MEFLRKQWPSIGWAIIIVVLMGIPGTHFPEVVTFWDWLTPDKMIHIALFGTFSFLVMHGFKAQFSSKESRSIAIKTAVFGMVFGGITELMQSYVFVGRDGNIFDFFANFIGTLIGIGIYFVFWKNKRKKLSNFYD